MPGILLLSTRPELVLADAADEVEVEGVEDPAANGRTEAIATVVDPGVVEAVVGAVVEAAVDPAGRRGGG
jgi:hypothetical protein